MNLKYWFISITGISFWFFLGFPFANYHESYGWAALVNSHTLTDTIFHIIGHYQSYRPMGQIIGVFLYKSMNDSLAAIQLLNYAITILSFYLMTYRSEGRKVISLLLMAIGFIFFGVFSYLFHLHGIYYCFILLYVSILVFTYRNGCSLKYMWLTFLLSAFFSLFHPLVLIIYVFYIVGAFVEIKGSSKIIHIFSFIFVILSSVILLNLLVPGQKIHLNSDAFRGALQLYAVDPKVLINVISFLFSILVILPMKIKRWPKYMLLLASISLATVFPAISLSNILVWLLACLIKEGYAKKWAMFSLILSAALFPFFTGSESGHLKFLVIVICAFITASALTDLDKRLPDLGMKSSAVFYLCLLFLLFLLRSGVPLPFVSRLVNPLLREREKTYQLENIIQWYLGSEYTKYNLNLAASSHKRPTTNYYLEDYLESKLPKAIVSITESKKLQVFFDGKVDDKSKLVYSVKGTFAGNASVFFDN